MLGDPRTVAEISDLDRDGERPRPRHRQQAGRGLPPGVDGDRGRRRCSRSTRRTTGQPAHRPAVARLRRRDPEQPAAVRGAARSAGVAPALASPEGPSANASCCSQRAVDASDAERRRIAATPARRTGAGPRRLVLRDRGRDRARRVHGTARPGRGAARRRGIGAHQHPGPAHAAGRHLPAQPGAGRPAVALPDLAQTVRAPGLDVLVDPVPEEELGLRPTRSGWSTGWRRRRCATPPGTPRPAPPGLPRTGGGRRAPRRGRRRARASTPRRRWPTPRAVTSGCSCWPSSPPPEAGRCRWPLLPGAAPTGGCVCIPASRPARRTVRVRSSGRRRSGG